MMGALLPLPSGPHWPRGFWLTDGTVACCAKGCSASNVPRGAVVHLTGNPGEVFCEVHTLAGSAAAFERETGHKAFSPEEILELKALVVDISSNSFSIREMQALGGVSAVLSPSTLQKLGFATDLTKPAHESTHEEPR